MIKLLCKHKNLVKKSEFGNEKKYPYTVKPTIVQSEGTGKIPF